MSTISIDEIYRTYQEATGASSRGSHFYSEAGLCGRRARLNEELRSGGPQAKPAEHFAVGIAYHLFMHLDATEQLPQDMALDMTDEAVDAPFLEGLRLVRGWRELWGSLRQKYGEVLASELEVKHGELDFTGRIDCVVCISDVVNFAEKTGLQLPGPGIYILDHKTAAGHNAMHAYQFSAGLQGRGYLEMYPEAKGVIFDVLYKVKTFRHEPKIASTGKLMAGKSYAHYLQTKALEDATVIKNLVTIGKRNYEANQCNPAACFQGGNICPHLIAGRCNGT